MTKITLIPRSMTTFRLLMGASGANISFLSSEELAICDCERISYHFPLNMFFQHKRKTSLTQNRSHFTASEASSLIRKICSSFHWEKLQYSWFLRDEIWYELLVAVFEQPPSLMFFFCRVGFFPEHMCNQTRSIFVIYWGHSSLHSVLGTIPLDLESAPRNPKCQCKLTGITFFTFSTYSLSFLSFPFLFFFFLFFLLSHINLKTSKTRSPIDS